MGKNYSEDEISDLELDRELLRVINGLVRPTDLPRRAIRAAILSALPDVPMPDEDRETVRLWLGDVAAGRL